jgi:LmbE family N-acetylglucosaminyl deacetylase
MDMLFRSIGILAVCILLGLSVHAQPMVTPPSSEILNRIKALNVLGSVLYIAAHPDDENTRLLAYLANGKQYRTAYLSLTRGDGGQNLIGNEQSIELGLIRTNELMAARRVDGAEQFFTRAYDFGFSKSPEETFTKWDRNKVLSDVVWVVRTFQPDVIIARFPEDSRAGHGHHSASGIMAREAFEAAGDSTRFPEHFQHGAKPWKPKRVLWNTFNFGGRSTIDENQFKVDAGGYNPLTGLSFGELAGESRSQHKSQGFGVPRSRGEQWEYFVPIGGDKPTTDLLDGVDMSWSRLPFRFSSDAVKKAWIQSTTNLINTIIRSYNPEAPHASVPGLLQLHKAIKEDVLASNWRTRKLKEVEDIILSCMGLYAEAIVPNQFIPENEKFRVTLNIINRSPVKATAVTYRINGEKIDLNKSLPNNQNQQRMDTVAFPYAFMESQPYWLKNGISGELFDTRDQRLIGKPVNDPLQVTIEMMIEDYRLDITRPIQYKFTDPVKGEIYQPVFITPRHLVYSNNDIILFKKGQQDTAGVRVYISSWEETKGKKPAVSLESKEYVQSVFDNNFNSVSNGLNAYEFKIPNYLSKKGMESDELTMYFRMDGETFTNAQRTINYDHIPTLRHYYQDRIKVLNIDLKLSGKRVGYIEGAGDRVASALEAMGYAVEILKEEDLTESNLRRFDAIVTGIRAYNVHEYLTRRYDALMKFVENGGNLIVQYNTSSNIGPIKAKMSPYDLSISRTRVTDEASPVKFLLPEDPVLNTPNKITIKDFEGWIQERSIYHGGQYPSAFRAPIALQDFGEGEEAGSLLIAPYGKGNFVYTGLVFFRQLPAGVPGAFRLMANLIGLPKNK